MAILKFFRSVDSSAFLRCEEGNQLSQRTDGTINLNPLRVIELERRGTYQSPREIAFLEKVHGDTGTVANQDNPCTEL